MNNWDELYEFLKNKSNVEFIIEYFNFSGKVQFLFDEKWKKFQKECSIENEDVCQKKWEDYVTNELSLKIIDSVEGELSIDGTKVIIMNPGTLEKSWISIPKEFAVKTLTLRCLP